MNQIIIRYEYFIKYVQQSKCVKKEHEEMTQTSSLNDYAFNYLFFNVNFLFHHTKEWLQLTSWIMKGKGLLVFDFLFYFSSLAMIFSSYCLEEERGAQPTQPNPTGPYLKKEYSPTSRQFSSWKTWTLNFKLSVQSSSVGTRHPELAVHKASLKLIVWGLISVHQFCCSHQLLSACFFLGCAMK